MAAACGTAALGKRKRSSRITLDEDDTEGEFATTDPATTADDHHRRSSNVPPTVTPCTGLRGNTAVQLNRAHNVNGDGVLYHTLARATRVSRDLRICIADKTPPFRDHCHCYAWVSNRAVGDSTLCISPAQVLHCMSQSARVAS